MNSKSVERVLSPAALMLTLLCLALCFVPATRSSSKDAGGADTPSAPQSAVGAQAGAAAVTNVRRVALATRDILVDPAAQTIYASVPGAAGPSGNSVVTLDPATGAVGNFVFVGSEPNILALSGDRQFLYVGLDGEAAVRRFDVATQTASLRVPLGVAENGSPVYAEDIEVMPGAPGTIAVARRRLGLGGSHEGVAVFDEDVQRPAVSDRTRNNNSIEFAPTGSTLYGYDKQTSNSVLRRLSVGASGVTLNLTPAVNLGVYGDFEVSGNLLYHSSGRVVNTDTFTLAGQYQGMTTGSYYPARAVAVDEPNNRVYFVTDNLRFSPGQQAYVTVWAYEKDTFAFAGKSDVTGITGNVTSLVRWGARGLAFRDGAYVYLLQTDLVPGAEPIPTPSPTPGGPAPTPTPTPTPTPGPGEFRALGLTTRDLVADPNTQAVYASVPPTAGAGQNSVIAFDPATGAVTSSTFVGTDPNRLAVSKDGQYVYVGLDGERAVLRLDAATRTAGLKFSLGDYPAGDIAVMPGAPGTVAVTHPYSGAAVYDEGVRRPLVANSDFVYALEFSNSPSVLYGSAGSASLAKMTVAECGVGVARRAAGVVDGGDLLYDNGRLYTIYGRVVDAETGALLGTFDVPQLSGVNQGPLLAIDPSAGRIHSVTSDGTALRLRVFDMKTFVLLGELRLPGVTGQATSLVRWGADGLAFRTDAQVYVLQNQLIAAPAPAPAPTPAPPATPLNFSVGGSVFALNTPVEGVTVGYAGTRAGAVQTNALGRFAITDLPLCSTLTVTPSKPFWTFTPASVPITNPAAQAANFSAFHRVVGFVSAQVSASEGQHRVFLAVSRSVNNYGAASLSYTVTPGSASGRNDFTGVNGTFRFEPGVAQAPIEILLTDDAFVEGPETFTVTLGDPVGLDAEIITPSVTVTILDNDTVEPTTSPLGDARFFVRRHYQDFLNRDPSSDPSGFNFWTAEIAGCNAETDPQRKSECLAVKRINVSAAFFLSIEFQGTGYFVHRLYATSYPASAQRPRGLPRYGEFMRDTREVARNVIVGAPGWQQALEQNRQAFALRWVSLPEFLAGHPESQSAGDYVDSLFANAGARPADAERAAALAAYGAGGPAGRAAALRSVVESRSVFDAQFNKAFVLMQYFGYLRRDADAAPDADFGGYQFWLSKLDEFGGDYIRAEMVKAFLASTEYQQRFGPANFDLSR